MGLASAACTCSVVGIHMKIHEKFCQSLTTVHLLLFLFYYFFFSNHNEAVQQSSKCCANTETHPKQALQSVEPLVVWGFVQECFISGPSAGQLIAGKAYFQLDPCRLLNVAHF